MQSRKLSYSRENGTDIGLKCPLYIHIGRSIQILWLVVKFEKRFWKQRQIHCTFGVFMLSPKNRYSPTRQEKCRFHCSLDQITPFPNKFIFLARWLTSARAYRIGGRKLCPSVCLYVKRYLLLQFCTDYNQTWINMIWAVAAKTLLSQIFHNWRRIEVNCVYISHCKWYRTSAGMPACIPNRRCCAGQCAGQ